MEKKLSARTCIVCRKKDEKKKLMRIVRNKNGFEVDKEQNKEGRGCYVCRNEKCKADLILKRALSRAYKMNVNNEIYDIIQKEL